MENLYNKMKELLGNKEELSEEVKMMAEAFLVDGTKIATDSDSFEKGSLVFVLGEDDEKMALPSGTYELQDGGVLEVVDGEVTDMKTESDSEETAEEEMSAEEVVEKTTEKEELDLSTYMTKEDGFELGKLITEAVELKIAEKLAEMTEAHNTELEKVKKLSAQKSFKHTPKSHKREEVKIALTSEDRILQIFNKTKNK